MARITWDVLNIHVRKAILVIRHLTTLTLAQSCKLFVVFIIVMYKTNDVVLQHSVLHDKYTKIYHKKT